MVSGLSRFLAELRRRRVLPTAVGYAVVGLGLIEGSDVVFSRLSLPGRTIDFVLWAVLLGFPAALVLAWFFDFSPDGIKRTPGLTREEKTARALELSGPGTWALGSTGVVVILISGYLALGRDPSAVPPHFDGQGPRAVVVLPFENLGPPDQDWFVDGIVQELTDKLDMVGGLRVMSRTSADTYKDSEKTLRQIGEELGVEFVVEGDVRREPSSSGLDRVRISVRLFHAADENRIWSHAYERDRAGIFRLETEIAERVAEGAGAALGQDVESVWAVPPTGNTEAHDRWMEGRYVRGGAGEESGVRALALFEEAVELDPGFWWAWADISSVKSYQGRDDRSPELCEEAREALERATALAGEDPTIHHFWAWYLYRCPNDYDRALEELELIRTVLPGQYYRLKSAIYGRQGNAEARLEAMLHAYDLDPRSATRAHELSVIFGVRRKFRESLAWAERAIDADPSNHVGYLDKGFLVLALNGDADSARAVWRRGQAFFDPEDRLLHDISLYFDVWARDTVAVFDRLERMASEARSAGEPETGDIPGLRGTLLYFFGRPEEAKAPSASARVVFEGRVESGSEDAWLFSFLAQAYAGLGRREEALRAADRAVELVSAQGGRDLADQLHEKALTQVMLGDFEEAIATLEAVHATGAGYHSAGRLRAEVYWDALGDYPRFQALLERYRGDVERY